VGGGWGEEEGIYYQNKPETNDRLQHLGYVKVLVFTEFVVETFKA
jgi:hypothetical protein